MGGRRAVVRHKPSSGLDGRASLDMGMSVAATKDRHVILGTASPPGVYRFAGNDNLPIRSVAFPTMAA